MKVFTLVNVLAKTKIESFYIFFFRIDDKKDEKSGGKKKPDNLKEIQVKLGLNQGTLTVGLGLVPLA
jgi:hypothetical protein